MADAPEDYAAWLGRTEEARDVVTAGPLDRLSATLDRDDPPHATGDAVPPLGHWLFFLPSARQSEIGPDGHPKRGGFLPPVHHLPRRMWAGSRVTFPGEIRVGDAIVRRSVDRLDQGEGGEGEPAGLRHRPPRDRPGRTSRPRSSTSTTSSIAGSRRRQPARSRRRVPAGAWRRTLTPDARPALPLFGAHLQQPPHPLRPRLRHRGRGLSRPRRPRPADRDAARRPDPAERARGEDRRLLLPRRLAAVRRARDERQRRPARSRRPDEAVGRQRRGRARGLRRGDAVSGTLPP